MSKYRYLAICLTYNNNIARRYFTRRACVGIDVKVVFFIDLKKPHKTDFKSLYEDCSCYPKLVFAVSAEHGKLRARGLLKD